MCNEPLTSSYPTFIAYFADINQKANFILRKMPAVLSVRAINIDKEKLLERLAVTEVRLYTCIFMQDLYNSETMQKLKHDLSYTRTNGVICFATITSMGLKIHQ